MAAEDACFAEEALFTEFEVEKAESVPLKDTNHCNEKRSSQCLMEENLRLKKSLKTLMSLFKCVGPSSNASSGSTLEDCSPLFQVSYFDNSTSIRNKEKVEEFVQSLQRDTGDSEGKESFGSENFQPSIFELNYELDNLVTKDKSKTLPVISTVQYYKDYCIDCCGFPLVDQNPKITDGWNIPNYEQVYFNVLSCNEETPKVKIRPSRTCFNCGKCGHNVQDCPEPQDLARINANRKDFRDKFVSPTSLKSRYVEDVAGNRFNDFKAGVISENLKQALGLGDEDLPLYIYRMRYHGYPPGYLPRAAKPSLLLYDGDGNIDDYVIEEEDNNVENLCKSFIKYPGFNVPLPEGVRDNFDKLGMWPMQPHQHIENLAADFFRRERAWSGIVTANQCNRKRKRPEIERDEQDMEVDEDGGKNALLELGSAEVKKTKYELTGHSSDDNNTGYSPSHPGLQCGEQEEELLKRYREHGEGSSVNDPHPQRRAKRKHSLEEGEVLSDEEADVVEEEEEEEKGDHPETKTGWWLEEPLTAASLIKPKISPPPNPSVRLPLEALSRFYTNSTVLQKMSFEDRVMWLDPIYGNLQPVSGRYDRLRKLLGKKDARK